MRSATGYEKTGTAPVLLPGKAGTTPYFPVGQKGSRPGFSFKRAQSLIMMYLALGGMVLMFILLCRLVLVASV